jgi:hypothetical protein
MAIEEDNPPDEEPTKTVEQCTQALAEYLADAKPGSAGNVGFV